MEIVVIILLVILVILGGFLAWDGLRARQRWREQSEALTKLVGEKVEGSIGVFGEVRERLGELVEKTRVIEEAGKNISSLQEILRAPKPRGGLGELLLERLLADSLPRGFYELQYQFQNGETVDAVVRIGKNLVPIDAKFPLDDFQRMVAAESEEEQASIKKQFIRTVKKHIDDVAKYIRPDENTLDCALMYVPAENVYYETMLQSDVCSHCFRKKVFLVSPNSFHAYLQAIILGLRGLHVERTAREILGRLERLRGDFNAFYGDYETLGGHLERATRKYGDASAKLTRLGEKLQLAGEVPLEELPDRKAKKGEDGE